MYECGCDDCKINLAADPNGKNFKSVLKAAENAFKFLHEKGSYKAEDIGEKPYQKLIKETEKVFNSAITDNDIPAEMLAKLQNDTFIFSGLKTHAQLLEASSFLRDEKGQIRNFDAFANEFNKVNKKYNQNYLEAEHQFAINSSQMAANWAATDPNGRYNLQYRTANDDRVRENHRVLQDITLPKEDSFWLSYYPPNGWRCRCTAVEVLKAKYELSDSDKAIKSGEKATSQIGKDGKNKLEIFRFNPGAEQKVFPPKHPYNKVKDVETIKEILKEKPVEYEQLTMAKLENLQEKQNIDRNKEIIIMGNFDGYVATSNSFYLNRKLRAGDTLGEEDLKTVTALDDLIKANPLTSNIILHRNVNFDFIENHFTIPENVGSFKEMVQAMKDSDVKSFSDKGFCSTSAVKTVNVFQDREISMEIRAKAGTYAFIAENFVESEVILARNQKMNIIDIESLAEGKIKIIVEAD